MPLPTKPHVVREALTECSKLAFNASPIRSRAWLKIADIASDEELVKLASLLK